MNWAEIGQVIVPVIGAALALAWNLDRRFDKVERSIERLGLLLESKEKQVEAHIQMVQMKLDRLEERSADRDQTLGDDISQIASYLSKTSDFNRRVNTSREQDWSQNYPSGMI